MAKRTTRRKTATKKAAGSPRKGRTEKSKDTEQEKSQEISNREIAHQKLGDLTRPILKEYGVSAFDEVVSRLENTVTDFSQEVSTLFEAMVSRAKEDHERMKSLLTREDVDEPEVEEEVDTPLEETEISEYEKRLERQERQKQSGSDE